MPLFQDVLASSSGVVVGIILGLIGAGGSILALPLMFYVVGIPSHHVAVGTSAVAVAASALFGLAGHARAKTVRWRCALIFAASGITGALAGSIVGKYTSGKLLLGIFGLLMVLVGAKFLWSKSKPEFHQSGQILSQDNARELLPRLVGYGIAVGLLSGFFGIGGGFLIVPGLVSATAMPILNAIGSSLVSVTAFGATSAASYAYSGLVDWRVAAFFIAGGAVGSLFGMALSSHLSEKYSRLLFGASVILVGLFIVINQANLF